MKLRRKVRNALLATAAVLAVGALGCEGRPRTGEGKDAMPKHGPFVAVVDLTQGVPEVEPSSLFAGGSRKRSFDELLGTLQEIEKDDDAKAVLVKLGSVALGPARAQELAERLEALGAKKRVTCHADGYSNATYMMAARGCSSLWMSPAGEVEAVGLAAQVVYFRRLLAEELHLSIDMLQVGKFKGAEEPFTRDGPSPEARASLTAVLADMRKAWLETSAHRKKPGIDTTLEDGPYAPARSKDLGLVDEVGFSDEAAETARKASSAVRDKIVFGPGGEEGGDALDEIVRALAGDTDRSGPVALVRATGSISMGGGGGLFGGRGGIVEKELNKQLARLEKDDAVKAVVLRIDSPGGSALASDLMWHQLMKLRKKKPLVVSVGDMAASGGYYLSCSGDVIFAEPMSIVGSIGVVGGKIGVGEALEKVGVHAETFPANAQKPGAAARAAYESPLVRWDDPTRARALEGMTSVYELFLSRIVEGRSTRGRTITRERVAESAEGRIFGGLEAKARGLVDEIGGLTEAIAKAKELADLPATAGVSVVRSKPGLLDALEPGGAEEKAKAHMSGPSLESSLGRIAPDLLPFVLSVAPLAEGERAVVSMPFALVVR